MSNQRTVVLPEAYGGGSGTRDEPDPELFDSLSESAQKLVGSPEEAAYADSAAVVVLGEEFRERLDSEDPEVAEKARAMLLWTAAGNFAAEVLGFDERQSRDLLGVLFPEPLEQPGAPEPAERKRSGDQHKDSSLIRKVAALPLSATVRVASGAVTKVAQIADIGEGLGTRLSEQQNGKDLMQNAMVLASQPDMELALYSFQGVVKNAYIALLTDLLGRIKNGQEISANDWQGCVDQVDKMPAGMTLSTLRFKDDDLEILVNLFPNAPR